MLLNLGVKISNLPIYDKDDVFVETRLSVAKSVDLGFGGVVE